MNTKKIAVWISLLASFGGIFAYARARDMDLKTVEVKQDEMKERYSKDIQELKKMINQIHMLLINKEK